ncbi:hypothetical protein MBR80_005459 [Klebsiella pneumoniae]|nr:hypothetical protein [Klebsiella pneumoniae]
MTERQQNRNVCAIGKAREGMTIDVSVNPFQSTGTVWLYDYSRNTVIEKRSDGTNITHISPQGGKRFFLPVEPVKPKSDT